MATGAEVPGNIINVLLSARKYGKKRVEQFMKNILPSRVASFYDPMQRSTTITSLKNKKQRKAIFVLKENRHALELFVKK